MNSEKIKTISIFSGCGGLDLGFKKEGFDIQWALDHDNCAVETHRKNFDGTIVNKDIVEIDFSKVPDCDVILGGFPCQDFSVIWTRPGIHGQRGDLYRHFVRAVSVKQPKIFVAENVKGLLSANKGKAIKQIISDFESLGYKVFPHVYNFADYGVPQFRERLIMIGIRNDIDTNFIIPKPTHGTDRKFPYVTAEKALKNVGKIKANSERMNIAEKTKKMLELIPPGENFSAIPKSSPLYVKGLISHVYRRLHKDKPSYTIIASGGGGTWTYHYSEPRPLTNRERARIQSFPDDFEFVGSMTEVRKQIGNAVPPEGVRPIAKTIKRILENNKNIPKPKRSSKKLDWMEREIKADKQRIQLDETRNQLDVKFPDWRGIETYSSKEISEFIKKNDISFDKIKKIIQEHYKFYCNYYGKNGNLNARMNQCEYNIHTMYSELVCNISKSSK
jgi:DNA (cytosine-5)-methyltransferase 1